MSGFHERLLPLTGPRGHEQQMRRASAPPRPMPRTSVRLDGKAGSLAAYASGDKGKRLQVNPIEKKRACLWNLGATGRDGANVA